MVPFSLLARGLTRAYEFCLAAMTKSWIRRAIKIAVGVAILPLAFVAAPYVMNWLELPGSMPSDYPAKDYDARLTREARGAKPVIDALQRYYAKHSAYPEHAKDIVPFLSTHAIAQENDLLGWKYSRSYNGPGYELCRELGWDIGLRFRCDPSQAQWVFDRGDGDAKVPIILEL